MGFEYMVNSIFFTDFFNNIDILMVILVRLTGFFILLPIFSGTTIPNTAKIAFILPLGIMIYSGGAVTEISYDSNTAGLVFLLIKEFMVGLTLSFAVYTIFMTLFMAGQFMDYQIGFSMVSIFDPVTQIQVPITGNFLYMLIILLLVRTGGLHAFIGVIFKSFEVLPVGTAEIFSNKFIASYMLSLLTDYFSLGVQIAMPIVGAIFIVDISLGLLVKAAPQMNVFVVGMPIKLLIGLYILYYIIPVFAGVYDHLFEQSYKAVINIMGGLSP
ncbi:flagellar biosynthetic protein FliR [Anaeropeptidivorans aminofermentans]|jgi:flagellar biosynthetic protein FliR|uniref:flagellar biosynthetic protein FliR n=1 Tax=Anaeropeptidivorans aminofermentans TaxID=2934315 RepID=UPI0020258993|nr:flagellar biosynthetic protein FliR [Anaeropeptidivorans aminofermentans]